MLIDITAYKDIIDIINNALTEGKMLEITNLPRKDVPVNIRVVAIDRKALTEKK